MNGRFALRRRGDAFGLLETNRVCPATKIVSEGAFCV